MTLALQTAASFDGPLRNIDARWKIAGFTAAILCNAALTSLASIWMAVAFALLLACATTNLRRLIFARFLPLVGMLTFFFGWSIFWPRPGEEPWIVAGLTLSPSAATAFLATVGRTVALVTLFVALFESAPLHELGQGAAGLGVPRVFIHLTLLTHRHIFILGEEFSRIRRALRVRGFRSRMDRRSFATIGNVAGSLFIRSHERAERVHHAMTARGFDGDFRSLATPDTRAVDIGFFALMLVPPTICLAFDRGWFSL